MRVLYFNYWHNKNDDAGSLLDWITVSSGNLCFNASYVGDWGLKSIMNRQYYNRKNSFCHSVRHGAVNDLISLLLSLNPADFNILSITEYNLLLKVSTTMIVCWEEPAQSRFSEKRLVILNLKCQQQWWSNNEGTSTTCFSEKLLVFLIVKSDWHCQRASHHSKII